ncbi:MAG: virulence-associated E family protein [Clostridiales bacterium]|nr:virulence-associated E family protein [Clostridiales bacterium]
MKLQYDRKIVLSVASTRWSKSWQPWDTTISALYDRLEHPVKGTESLSDYLALKKAQQDDLKDVGGFVGGSLNGGHRKANAVTGRDIVTLDFDTIPPYGTEQVLKTVDSMGCGYTVYSTRKHMPTAPRLRILFPLDRTVSADEYEPIARYLAAQIGIQMADKTTFEACRLMYWPSCSADAEYVFEYGDKPLVSADKILGTYKNWKDFSSWPQVPGAVSYQKLAMKQGEPEEKSGVVGAFCRCYDVISAMDKFLPGIYAQCDNAPDRYTYLGGSTAGGAIIYDNGKFLYSHHATDPCSGRLVNAFDLVRLHKFGDSDDEAVAGTPVNRLPSYTAMCALAAQDAAVSALIAQERHDQAMKDYEGLGLPTVANSDPNWIASSGIAVNNDGKPFPTMANIGKLLANDPLLRDKIRYNEFADRIEVHGALPWNGKTECRRWTDTDINGLYQYMETFYGITKRVNIDSAFDVYASQNGYNPLTDYLNGLEWDGVPRLDTLFIDYMGAEDDSYTRCVTRKIMVAAVARAMEPGCKFDNMLVLCGTQGLGKSSILDKLALGWFNDSILTFEGKDAAELIQGVWIVEIAELHAMRRTDVTRVKQFLSQRIDRFRPAYGRNVKEAPRSCVFFGTANDKDFLDDMTGNRRFWPVDVDIQAAKKEVWKDLTDDEIAQIWAEAKVRWQIGEKLYLTKEEEAIAAERQEAHREASPMEGPIMEFIEHEVPEDWDDWSLVNRVGFWNNTVPAVKLVPRKKICAAEIWLELYGGTRQNMARNPEFNKIKPILRKLLLKNGWRETSSVRYGPVYGTQRAFVRE